MDRAPRLNLITGDNGLGKSFLLDVAWRALTRTWAGLVAQPLNGGPASIDYAVKGKAGKTHKVSSTYRARRQFVDSPGPAGHARDCGVHPHRWRVFGLGPTA